MKLFFTSDLHFGHLPVIAYCNRPFASVKEMDEALIDNWNRWVSQGDTVFVVGDLALCPYRDFAPIAPRLRGNKILIKGNHDKYSRGQYERAGFQVFDEVKLSLYGKTLRLSHYPYAPAWYQRPFLRKRDLRYLARRPPKIKGEVLIHGHTHQRSQHYANCIHVGVDAWDYRPASQNEIESILFGVGPVSTKYCPKLAP